MKNFFYKNRKGVVLVMGLVLYALLLLTLLVFLSFNNPQVLRLSRTSVVMIFTFITSTYLLMHIYGKYDIGIRKSKPIVISVSLGTFFADLITSALMVIMNTNETTNNEMYPYFGWDLLMLFFAFLVQVLVIVLMTYGGHAIYFSFVPPERLLLVKKGSANEKHLREAIAHYKKQYKVCKTIQYDDPALYDEILKYDAVFLNQLPHEATQTLVEYCYKHSKIVYRTLGLSDLVTFTSRIMLLNDESFLASQVKEKNMMQRIVKRIFDIIFSAFGLIITSPLLLIAFIAIKIEDGGPVIFSQNRVTIGRKIFNVHKIRTMKENADGSLVTEEKDGRITRVGYWLRKFRIDEIPQFFDVIVGNMSVVGPRAEMADRVFMNMQSIPEYEYRYRMKAGITGYAQIMGKYNTSAQDKLMLDLTYIQTFSLWNDTKILFQTIMVVLRPDKSTEAYKKEDIKENEKIKEIISGKNRGQ